MPDARPYEVLAEDGIAVELPSGATYYVLTDEEARYLQERITQYLEHNHFVNISDMQDIDKMITFELLIHRWTMWLSKGKDYFDEAINVKQYSDMTQDYSREVRQLKKALGVDKSTRDRTRGDDSISALWSNLQRRAREFGYMRNKQYEQVIVSFQRLKALMIFHQRCDEVERKENACEMEDVFEVLKEEIKKFDEIDEKFRFEQQALWIRNQ